jgi:hypothetical protein
MKVEKIGNYLIIDGEYYAPTKLVEHTTGQKLEFKKIPKEDFEIIKKLAKKLSKNINA